MSVSDYLVSRMAGVDWSVPERAPLSHTGWLPPCPVAAWFQACHDVSSLYLRMEAEESPVHATLIGPLDQVCRDSCLEFFFAPDSGDRYFNFELNPLGTLCLGFGTGRSARVRQVPKDLEQFQIEPFLTPKGWGVSFAVPADFVRLYFPGFTLSGEAAANFYKCGDDTPVPHYLAWSPMTSSAPDFHRRQDFGRLVFE